MAKGRLLSPPPGRATRPTSDKVREAVFSMLSSMDLVEGATVADLFAGSGALGIEALSRGADSVTLVDSDPAAIRAIKANLAGFPERNSDAVIIKADVARFLAGAKYFDTVLADPPYRFDRWSELLILLAPRTGTLVAESDRPLEMGPAWETVKVRKYGGTVVTVAKPAAPPEESPPIEGEI